MALDIYTWVNEEVEKFVKSSLPGREVYCNYLSDSSTMHLCNRCIQEQIDNKSQQSIKLLKMFRMAEDDHTKWNEGLAEEHLDDMCKILNDSFIKESDSIQLPTSERLVGSSILSPRYASWNQEILPISQLKN